MTRILCVGDLHGDLTALEVACVRSHDLRCNAVLQLGDWGFIWPGREMLHAQASVIVKDTDTRFVFIDGNHDYHDGIRAAYPSQDYYLPDIAPGQMVYLDRGRTLSPETGAQILGMGGAGSVDRRSRVPGRSWFATEAITEAEVAAVRRFDIKPVLACHDTPRIIDALLPGYSWPEDALRACAADRDRLVEVVALAKPQLIIHGHMHYSATSSYAGIPVRALAHAQSPGGFGRWATILNLDGPETWLEDI